jgi:hypothetical protein
LRAYLVARAAPLGDATEDNEIMVSLMTTRMRATRCLVCSIVIGAFALGLPSGILAQSRFRSSLTATVTVVPGRGKTANVAAVRGGPSVPATEALECREVALHWAELSGSRRYAVYVAARSTGPWMELPSTNVCGAVRRASATSVVDIEPTAGAAAVIHRLYYKVVAFAGLDARAATLDVTEPISVEFP